MGFSLPPATRERVAALAPHAQLFDVATDRDLGQVLALLGERASGDLVTKWDDDDWYATEHLRDLVAAMRYSGAGIVAKPAEYVYLSSLDLTLRRFSRGAETFSTTIAGGTLMLTRSLLHEVGVGPPAPDELIVCSSMRSRQWARRSTAYTAWDIYSGAIPSPRTIPGWRRTTISSCQAVDQRPGLDLEFAGVVA